MQPPDHPQSPIEAYLSDVARRLGRRLPADIVEQKLAEAREHLSLRVADLVAQGKSTEDAEAAAVAAFGPAGEWARMVSDSAYADTGALKARRVSLVAGLAGVGIACLAIVYLAMRIIVVPFTPSIDPPDVVILYSLSALVLVGANLRARRAITALLATASVIAAVGVFLFLGTYFTYGRNGIVFPRSDYLTYPGRYRQIAAHVQVEQNLLELGFKTYGYYDARTGTPKMPSPAPPVVPAELRAANGGYIVPRPLEVGERLTNGRRSYYPTSGGRFWPSAFKEFHQPTLSNPYQPGSGKGIRGLVKAVDETPYLTTRTRAEATRVWQQPGMDSWLPYVKDTFDQFPFPYFAYAAQHPKPVFCTNFALNGAGGVLLFCAPLVLLDVLSAWVGRWAFRRRRARPASACSS